MLKNNLKRLLKSPHISIPLLILLLSTVGINLYAMSSYFMNSDIFAYAEKSLWLCIIGFIINFYASYEFFYQIRFSDTEETIQSYHNVKNKSDMVSLLLLAVFPFVQFVISLFFNCVLFSTSGMTNDSYMVHITLVYFLYIFLGGVTAVIFGALTARKIKRIVAYTIFALVLFLMSGISAFIFEGPSLSSSINFWQIKYFFAYLLPNNLNTIPYDDYGFPCELYRWNLSLFWVLFLLMLLIFTFRLTKKKLKIISVCLCAAAAAVNLTGYLMGGSHIEAGSGIDSIFLSDYVYYKNNKTEVKQQSADFKITKYEMLLNISRQLDAEVTMSLSDHQKGTYLFTLYHQYAVSNVTDESGNPLKYSRSGDYIDIKPDSSISKIKIKYSGYSSVFYSSSQGTALPGNFPFYPMAGYYDLKAKFGEYNHIFAPKTEYSVTVNAPQKIYSNLKETGDHTFYGKTNCPVFAGGLYEETDSDEYHICNISSEILLSEEITPEFLDDVQKKIDQLDKNSGIHLKDYYWLKMSLTFCNQAFGNNVLYSEDGIMLSSVDSPEETAKSIIEQKKIYDNAQ